MWRLKFVLTLIFPLALALAGCRAAAPTPALLGLHLAPATLGATVSVQQHLTVEREGRTDELDAALEVDGQAIDLVGLAFGQRVMTLHVDGAGLRQWRHPMLPAEVRAESVLQDLQLTLWPREALASALPAGWSIADEGLLRTLRFEDKPVMTMRYSALPRWSGTVVLDNLRYHYRLTITSVANATDGTVAP